MKVEKYRVPSKGKISLKDFDPNETALFDGSKKDGVEALVEINADIEKLQEQLYAEGKHKLLVVLQATDTGGKDGTIRAVFEHVNPQGVKVASFKVPSSVELAHDYLWRIHQQVPAKGEIVIFNRSHYEDVLAVRVHGLAPEKVWSKRYEHIKDFERMLTDEGTTILKFFLHIDENEQAERLLARVEDRTKQWKFSPGDLEERKLWKEYQAAFEDMVNKTSTDWAPWYVVPSNKKWYRNLVIAQIVRDTLKGFEMTYPTPVENLEQYRTLLKGMIASE
ncbi:MAG TPA: polyphosphate kinase 2 family protein [Anaerolineaceae bacterium]|nr:polyphosphate kinase 2 family protein [Anaerolineaceae bacterium]